MIQALPFGAGTAALAAGALLLRAACRAAPKERGARTAGGWALLIAGFALGSVGTGADLGLALTALAFSLAAYGVVLASVQVRARRVRAAPERHVAEDPLARPRSAWRFAARVALAGPLSLGFGIAVCLALATRTPARPADAMILGGLAAPVAFAAAMAWSLTDARLGRVAIGLVASSLVMTGLAAWPI